MYRYDDDQHNMALQGERFYCAGAILESEAWSETPCEECGQTHKELFPVLLSTFAFSAELFMKALLKQAGTSYARTHNLSALFNLLNDDQKNEIYNCRDIRQNLRVIDHQEEINGQQANILKNEADITSADIDSAIALHASCFETMRYLDRSDQTEYNIIFLEMFARRLKRLCEDEGLARPIEVHNGEA